MVPPEDASSSEIPHNIERYRKILKIIGDYKMKLVEKFTHDSQDPSSLLKLKPILKKASESIVDFVIRGDEPLEDEDLKICLNALADVKKEQPWNSDDRILIRAWCDKIFEDYMFSDTERILEIYKD